jgi:hypothetical protein
MLQLTARALAFASIIYLFWQAIEANLVAAAPPLFALGAVTFLG